MKNKILFYNWDYLTNGFGGGVSKYQNAIIKKFIEEDDYEIVYLNSGITYDMSGYPMIQKRQPLFDGNVEWFEIVNSPVIAPVQQSKKNIEIYLSDELLEKAFENFIVENNINVIHFNNIEGLSYGVFKLKQKFKNVKFILSIHNYSTICTQANLWKDDILKHGHTCDKKSYLECANCYYKVNYEMAKMLKGHEMDIWRARFAKLETFIKKDNTSESIYENYAEANVFAMNKYFDCILAVSDRVKKILIKNGVQENKVVVSYIGTEVADFQTQTNIVDNLYSEILKIVYMGYMREDKGFYFFIDALEKMDIKQSKNIAIKIVARYSTARNKNELYRIEKLKEKFFSVELINGYSKDNQKDILRDVHLGVVPVQWEDNLPQVAIEQIAYGVPILVSNLGGASELVNNKEFVFKYDDQEEFIKKILAIKDNRILLKNFWLTAKVLTTMTEHYDELLRIYNS